MNMLKMKYFLRCFQFIKNSALKIKNIPGRLSSYYSDPSYINVLIVNGFNIDIGSCIELDIR